MYDFFYWTYVLRGVSCRVVSVCTTFVYRVVLLRGSGSDYGRGLDTWGRVLVQFVSHFNFKPVFQGGVEK